TRQGQELRALRLVRFADSSRTLVGLDLRDEIVEPPATAEKSVRRPRLALCVRVPLQYALCAGESRKAAQRESQVGSSEPQASLKGGRMPTAMTRAGGWSTKFETHAILTF